jgi:hypothetical protein
VNACESKVLFVLSFAHDNICLQLVILLLSFVLLQESCTKYLIGTWRSSVKTSNDCSDFITVDWGKLLMKYQWLTNDTVLFVFLIFLVSLSRSILS